jgi:hypothetical protein
MWTPVVNPSYIWDMRGIRALQEVLKKRKLEKYHFSFNIKSKI